MEPIKQQRPSGVHALFKGEPAGKEMLDDVRKWIEELEYRVDRALEFIINEQNKSECSLDEYKQ